MNMIVIMSIKLLDLFWPISSNSWQLVVEPIEFFLRNLVATVPVEVLDEVQVVQDGNVAGENRETPVEAKRLLSSSSASMNLQFINQNKFLDRKIT